MNEKQANFHPHKPLNGYSVRSRVSHFMKEAKELLKCIKKWPVGQDANGLDSADGVIFGSVRIINRIIHIQPRPLFFGHLLFRITLIKSHSWPVHLRSNQWCAMTVTSLLSLWLNAAHTFSAASDTVRTKVEKTGLGVSACDGHHSSVAPIGKQNRGTESGRGKWTMSSCGNRAWMPETHNDESCNGFGQTMNNCDFAGTYPVCRLCGAACSWTSYSINIHRSPAGKSKKCLKMNELSSSHAHLSSFTIPLFRFFLIMLYACGGCSPLLVMTTQISETTKSLHEAVSSARR